MTSIFDTPQFNQNLFFPRPDHGTGPAGAEDLFIPVEGEIKVHVRRHPNPEARFSLLFFHGNGEIAADYDALAQAYHQLGADFVVCDYRGYGKSGGYPTLRGALTDAHAVYKALKEGGHLLPGVCVMGRSLGSAPAIELCASYPEIKACVIESGYADPIPLVERRGLKIDATTPDEDAVFNNSKKIERVKCPLLIMHGEDDVLIYPHEAKLNYQQAGSEDKALQILPGVGHNDILMAPDYGYFRCLLRFFEQVV
ncbi:putative Alpha/beta hydrolase fold protein [Nitrospina gracilis 3/211]|uniref:Putative Alpha/beta hydrolase fold protein n=1 Tax=Nitrospina gracilis (strain 3/211) TaxID=1266370 RepID=M1Z0K0_NITG3|nr:MULTISPECIES: alpha/beta hydrolase [Nitrospina]MCF8724354.1 pimeloyl-ACP methyl ester carboxylesterase [Nitrospina sp. Nb-3]CCQ91507.1 putative Alpha/beta hydrolase fold protein [Nitrospina gracilis 3/211]